MTMLQTPPDAASPAPRPARSQERSFYITGGTLPPDASSYVPRDADAELYDSLRNGEYCYVLNTRQMGKSSLMIRTAARLRAAGLMVAALDLTAIGQNVSPDQWYDGLLISLAEQVNLEDEMEEFWEENQRLGAMQRFLAALRQIVLPRQKNGIVLFVDEIDAVRSLPFSVNEFFGGIRECYNRRAQDESFEKLTFCLLGVATPADLIDDTRISPFNVGRRIPLTDFTPREAAPLAQGMGPKGPALLARVLYWTNGHPYMTQRLCRSVSEQAATGNGVTEADVDRLCNDLFLSKAARDTDDNLSFVRTRLLRSDADIASLLDLYEKVRTGKRVPDDETNPLCSVLRLSGVARIDERGLLQVRNRIYDRVFDKEWVIAHMPDAEIRRQKAAYWRGMARAAGVGTLITTTMAGLAVYAFLQANEARVARDEAGKNLQVANAEKNRAQEQQTRAQEQQAKAQEQKLLAQKQTALAIKAQEDAVKQKGRAEGETVRANEANKNLQASLAQVKTERERADSARDEARNQRDAALKARRIATEQSEEAVKQRKVAVTRSEESRRSQIRLAVDNGLRLASYGDYSGATLYLSEARRLEAHDPARDRLHSIRLSEMMQRNPRLAHLWSLRGNDLPALQPAGFTLSGGVLQGRNASVPFGTGAKIGGAVGPFSVWEPETRRAAPVVSALSSSLPARIIWTSPGGRYGLSERESTRKKGVVVQQLWSIAEAGKRPIAPISGEWEIPPLASSSAVSLSRDAKRIALLDNSRTIRVIDTASGNILLERRATQEAPPPTLSPNGQIVVFADKEKPEARENLVHFLRVSDGKERAAPFEFKTGLSAFRFNAKGDRLAVASPFITLFYDTGRWSDANAERSTTEPTLLKAASYTLTATFSPDGRFLALGDGSGEAIIYDGQTAKEVATIRAAEGSANLITFSPDGKLLATGGQSQIIKVWNTNALRSAVPYPLRHAAQVARCVFSPDSRLLLTEDIGGSARLWDMRQRPAQGRLLASTGGIDFIGQVLFSPDGRLGATLRSSGAVLVNDAASGAILAQLPSIGEFGYNGRSERKISFSPDSRFIVCPTAHGAAIYAARTGKLVTETQRKEGKNAAAPRRVLFTPDSQEIVTGEENGDIQFWSIATGKPVGPPLSVKGGLADIALSPDGRAVAYVTRRETAVWNRVTGATLRMEGPEGWVPGDRLDFRPDGAALICYGYGTPPPRTKGEQADPYQTVVWDLHPGANPGRYLVRLPHSEMVNAAAFSPDGKRIITCAASNAFLWDGATGRPLASPLAHGNTITAVGFTGDGVMGVTAGMDSVLRLWDASNGAFVLQREGREDNRVLVNSFVCMAIHPNGREFTGGGWVGAGVWELPQSPGSLSETLQMARLLSCDRFDPERGNVPLTQAALDKDWKTLRPNPVMGGGVPQNLEDLRRDANAQVMAEQYASAEKIADELLRRSPGDLDALQIRMGARANQGKFRAALDDVERTTTIRVDSNDMILEKALLTLQLGDVEGYRALCRSAFPRQKAVMPDHMFPLMAYLIYYPGALDDFKEPVRLLERSASRYPDDQEIQYLLIGLLYRAGRYADTVERSANLTKRRTDEWPVNESGSAFFAAMACARLKQTTQARDLMIRALQSRKSIPRGQWLWRAEADFLEKEARQTLKENSATLE